MLRIFRGLKRAGSRVRPGTVGPGSMTADAGAAATPTPGKIGSVATVAAKKNFHEVRSFWPLPDSVQPCPVCARHAPLFAAPYPSRDAAFRKALIVFCQACGSGFVPQAARLVDGYYAQQYAATNRKDRDISPEEYFKPDALTNYPGLGRYFARATAQVQSLRAHGANFDRTLDYGAGPGYFLFQSGATERYAVELDEASDKYLSFIGAKKIDPDALPRNFFSVILASHVVEHFTAEDLQKRLAQMAGALRPGGMMLIEVPQGGHSYLVLGTKQDPHTLFFTPQGIQEAIAHTGLKILAAYTRAKGVVPLNKAAIYRPDPANAFFSTQSGGLTVIAQRLASAPIPS